MAFSLLTGFNAPSNASGRGRAGAANLHLPAVVEKAVQPGTYEIQSYSTNLFLNSVDSPVYNGWCDDSLSLQTEATRNGKVNRSSCIIPRRGETGLLLGYYLVGDRTSW